LVTLYFALSKRNPSSGLGAWEVVGLLQDSLSRTPPGSTASQTLVGYVGSSIGARLDVEHPRPLIWTIGFYLFHHAVSTLTSHLLLAHQNETYAPPPS